MIEHQELARIIPFPTQGRRSHRPQRRAVWEEIQPKDPDDLMALVAMEVWQRTEAPAWSARIAEAELALIQSADVWRGYLRLEALSNELADAKTCQAAAIGFWLAAAGRELEDNDDDFNVEEWVSTAMEWAGLDPLDERMRLIYASRTREANAKRSKILQERRESSAS